MKDCDAIAETSELGKLGVPQVKRIWSSAMAERNGQVIDRICERHWDGTVLNALGLGLHQTLQYLFERAPTFAEFEDWILSTSGRPDAIVVQRLNAVANGGPYSADVSARLTAIDGLPDVLSREDLEFWEANGFVVLKNAVSEPARCAAENAIWQSVGSQPDSPDSWYGGRSNIMVELIQHSSLERNRRSERIHKAFAQLWGTADLWATADRCGFHPPQRVDFPFPGPDLHWDLDFSRPLEFGTQGILYLTDTPPEQGALTLVSGFHKELEDWLSRLPPGADPQQQDLHSLGSSPIGGEAGDLVIWHQFLPHGSRPQSFEAPENRAVHQHAPRRISRLKSSVANTATFCLSSRLQPSNCWRLN